MSYPVPGYASAAMDPRKPTPASRTLRSQDRGEIAAALSGHGLDGDTVTGLLDAAGLEGDRRVPVRWVCYCGAVAPHGNEFPHWDCQGGRPLTPDEVTAKAAATRTEA